MAKITSKYQVTVPKIIAEQYGLHPGDEIQWMPAGEVIRVIPSGQTSAPDDRDNRLRLFDLATERHRKRPQRTKAKRVNQGRGWTREDLYQRGRSR